MSIRFKALALIGLMALVGILGLFLRVFFVQAARTEVTFLDVGQGDAILISQGKNQILIDGGRSGKDLLSRLGRHIPFWDRRIEVVITTHPDADHVGGLAHLFRAYRVGALFSTGVTSDTEVVRYIEEARQKYGQPEPKVSLAGSQIRLPHGGELHFLYPIALLPKEVRDTNATSIVTRFVYGETSFLLTGDLAEEEKVLPTIEHATVLKAAHHGSKYSTSEAFLELVQPKEAVISVGENRYGHPAPEVLDRLAKRSVIVRRTDESGDVRYRCSEKARSCTYQR